MKLGLNISSSANGNRAASGSRDGTPGSGSRVPSPVTMKNPNHNTDEDWVMDEPTPAPSKAGGASTLGTSIFLLSLQPFLFPIILDPLFYPY